ncbi:MAG: DNA polymerase IV, partial [Firmicutes bacterium]|nr:DNA polymerase IV [Bacillota bacterium]
VRVGGEAKSLGSESTFDQDVSDSDTLRRYLARHSRDVGRRLRAAGRLAKTITVKVRFADFSLVTRGKSVREPVDDDDSIYSIAEQLLTDLSLRQPVRLLGVQVSGLVDLRQMSLFDADGMRTAEQRGLDHILDKIAERYGAKGVSRGREID